MCGRKGALALAIYHLSAKILSRSAGRSSVAAAAYRSSSRIRDERTGEEHDYTRKRGVEHTEIVAPPNAPDWMRDRAQLWNAVERTEKRRDAQLSREIEVALPRELAAERRATLVREFVQVEFVDKGMIADFAVHDGRAGDGGNQPHAHIMLTTRELLGDGFGPKKREWNAVDILEGWRAQWARHVNSELEKDGHDARIDHRTLEVQRAEAELKAERAHANGDARAAEHHEDRAAALDREPEPKLGPTASQMEKLGHTSRRGDERREVKARNSELRTLHEQARELAKQLADAARDVIEETRRRLRELTQRLDVAYRAIRGRAAAVTRPTVPTPGNPGTPSTAAPLDNAGMDVLLGRVLAHPVPAVGRDALLGRSSRQLREESAPDVAAILGRPLREHPEIEIAPTAHRGSRRRDRSRDRGR